MTLINTLLFGVLISLPIYGQIDSLNQEVSNFHLVEEASVDDWYVFKRATKGTPVANIFFDNKSDFNLGLNDELVMKNIEQDYMGTKHYRFDHYYKGVKVEDSEYLLHEDSQSNINVNGNIQAGIDISVVPEINFNTALNTALDYMSAEQYGWDVLLSPENGVYYSKFPSLELVIVNTDINVYELAYKLPIMTITPIMDREIVFVSAKNGEVCRVKNLEYSGQCDCCNGVTLTNYDSYKPITTKKNTLNYELLDLCRGDCIETTFSGKKVKDQINLFYSNEDDRTAASAHWAAEMFYDYFLETFNRDSYDGEGGRIHINCNMGGSYLDKAFYMGNGLVNIGQKRIKASGPLVSLDIIGHELSHGLVINTANLSPDFVAGGLNESAALGESFADIFGTMVEFYGRSGNGNYEIGEDFWIENGKTRDMSDPKSTSDADTYMGSNWLSPNIYPVAYKYANAGVQNYWFYLLAEGGSGTNDNSYLVNGIGRANAAKIAYHSLKYYLTSTSGYSDAMNASIWACINLYGLCSDELTQVINAWKAVGVVPSRTMGYDVEPDCTTMNLARALGKAYIVTGINRVVSDCDIRNGGYPPIVFGSGNEIKLNPGFHVRANFKAYINDCLTGANYRYAAENNETGDFEENPNTITKGYPNLIKLYPNPAKELINVVFSEDFNGDLLLYNLQGKLMKQQVVTEDKSIISLNGLPLGIYLVNLKGTSEYHKILKY